MSPGSIPQPCASAEIHETDHLPSRIAGVDNSALKYDWLVDNKFAGSPSYGIQMVSEEDEKIWQWSLNFKIVGGSSSGNSSSTTAEPTSSSTTTTTPSPTSSVTVTTGGGSSSASSTGGSSTASLQPSGNGTNPGSTPTPTPTPKPGAGARSVYVDGVLGLVGVVVALAAF